MFEVFQVGDVITGDGWGDEYTIKAIVSSQNYILMNNSTRASFPWCSSGSTARLVTPRDPRDAVCRKIAFMTKRFEERNL